MSKKKVLVTSGNTRVAYSICKSLAGRGYDVYVGDRRRFNMAAVSRHCKGAMTYNSPFTEQERFVDDINAFVRSKNIDVVVPVLEETFTLAKHREALALSGAAFLLPGYARMLTLHDKGRLTATAKALGIPVPETWRLEALLADAALAGGLSFPVIVKPKQGGGGWGMRTFHSAAELLETTGREIRNPGNYIVQTVARGQLIGVCGIYYNGRCIARDSYISTTVYPLRVGQPTTRQSRHYQQALDALKILLDHLNWHGVCEMDFIVDPDSGQCLLLDANPRFWGSVMQNIAAGVDYPWYYVRLAEGDTAFTPATAREGARTRWLGGELMRMAAECGEAQNKWKYLRDVFASPIRYDGCDDWDITDPLPFIAWGLNMIAGKVLKRRKDALPGVWE